VARKLLGVAEGTVSTFDVEPTEITDTDAVAGRIEAAVPGCARSESASSTRGRRDHGEARSVPAPGGRPGAAGRRVGIANTMLMSTTERFVEFGVMRTNGWTRRNILFLVTSECALLGLLSGGVLRDGGPARGEAHRDSAGFELDLRPG